MVVEAARAERAEAMEVARAAKALADAEAVIVTPRIVSVKRTVYSGWKPVESRICSVDNSLKIVYEARRHCRWPGQPRPSLTLRPSL